MTSFVSLNKWLTPHTVVCECCKDDQQSQCEMPNFVVCQLRNPWVDFQKKLQGWLRSRPHPTRKYRGQSVQRGHLRMREIVTLRRLLFFSFLGSMRFATGQPVGPIVVVNGSNDAPWWPLRPFYGFVNKKNTFPYFLPKNVKKIALRPMGTLNR